MWEQFRRLGLLLPIDEDLARQRRAAPALPALHGAVAGFLDNRKNNADRLLARIRDAMQAHFAFADIVWRSKFIYSRTATPEILEELAERCQFVITAIGD
jgi:hypothetical protein